MVYGHFAKLFVETFLVDRLAGRTQPVSSTMWTILFYWIGLGMIVGFSLFHPELEDEHLYQNTPTSIISKYIPASLLPAGRLSDQPDSYIQELKYQILALIFILAEFMNLQCHLHYTTKGK